MVVVDVNREADIGFAHPGGAGELRVIAVKRKARNFCCANGNTSCGVLINQVPADSRSIFFHRAPHIERE